MVHDKHLPVVIVLVTMGLLLSMPLQSAFGQAGRVEQHFRAGIGQQRCGDPGSLRDRDESKYRIHSDS